MAGKEFYELKHWKGSETETRSLEEIIQEFTYLFSHPTNLTCANNDLIECVNILKALTGQNEKEYLHGRGKYNIYECLGKGPKENPYLNRSALKLANLHSIFRILPTFQNPTSENSDDDHDSHDKNKKNEKNNEKNGDVKDELNYFSWIDICGGPGGFSEFILTYYDQSIPTYGFGMSLYYPHESSCNWNLDYLHDPPQLTIESSLSSTNSFSNLQNNKKFFRMLYGADSTGNILSHPNIHQVEEIIRSTLSSSNQFPSSYVHFCCGDGGMEEGRDKTNQELILLPLILSQIIVMIDNLQSHGNFLLKTFNLHQVESQFLHIATPSLLTSLDLSFVCFFVRSTSSERYVYCSDFKEFTREDRQLIHNFLWSYQESLSSLPSSTSSSNADTTSPSSQLPQAQSLSQAADCEMKRLVAVSTPFRDFLQEFNDSLLLLQLSSFLNIFHSMILEKDCIWEDELCNIDTATNTNPHNSDHVHMDENNQRTSFQRAEYYLQIYCRLEMEGREADPLEKVRNKRSLEIPPENRARDEILAREVSPQARTQLIQLNCLENMKTLLQETHPHLFPTQEDKGDKRRRRGERGGEKIQASDYYYLWGLY